MSDAINDIELAGRLAAAVEKIKAEAMGFNMGKMFPELMPGDEIDIAYSLLENIWQGRRSLTLKIKDLKLRKQMVK